MSIFTDCKGKEWELRITTKDVTLVERLVLDRDGEPIDLLAMADTGNLFQLYGDSRRMIDVVFVCLLEQISANFNEADFDAENEVLYLVEPELRENRLKKMGAWFGARVDGACITAMTEAFKEALVNFTRNPRQREALTRVLENQTAVEAAQADRLIQMSDDRVRKFQQGMDKEVQRELQKSPEEILEETRRAMN